MSVLTFVVVGYDDHPIFELDLSTKGADVKEDRVQYLHQFVLHAALDAVEEQMWTTNAMHLGVVDKFNALQVSAYITAAQIKFLLLHDGRSEDSVKNFFKEMYEVYLKVMLNPFFTPSTKITSTAFAQKVRSSAKQYFR